MSSSWPAERALEFSLRLREIAAQRNGVDDGMQVNDDFAADRVDIVAAFMEEHLRHRRQCARVVFSCEGNFRGIGVMKALDVMTSHVITVGPELDVSAVANTLVTNGISAVPVVAIDGSLVGIVSEGDLMRRAVSGAERKRSWWLETFSSADQLTAEFVKAHGRKAKDVMTRQVISVDPDTSLQEIANLLERRGIKRVPVVKDGRLVGIVSRANLVQALASRGLAFVDVTEADEALRKVILLKLRKLPWTAAMTMVDVIVDRGVVNLWGVVRNEDEKNAIRVAAEETPGVQAVKDHLRVYS